MRAFLIFIGACAAIVVGGWIVSKLTGSRTFFIEDWKLADGEKVLWRDDAADFYRITQLGQAQHMSVPRLHRNTVIVTSERILIGTEALYGKKRVVQYVLYRAPPADGSTRRMDGGLLEIGYTSIVVHPHARLDGAKSEVELTPDRTQASSTNIEALGFYTDKAASFPAEWLGTQKAG